MARQGRAAHRRSRDFRLQGRPGRDARACRPRDARELGVHGRVAGLRGRGDDIRRRSRAALLRLHDARRAAASPRQELSGSRVRAGGDPTPGSGRGAWCGADGRRRYQATVRRVVEGMPYSCRRAARLEHPEARIRYSRGGFHRAVLGVQAAAAPLLPGYSFLNRDASTLGSDGSTGLDLKTGAL